MQFNQTKIRFSDFYSIIYFYIIIYFYNLLKNQLLLILNINMRIRIIITILLAILLVIFTIQNSEIVALKLFFWIFEIPRALLIVVCIFIGVFIGVLIPKKRIKSNKNENDNSAGLF